MLTRTLMLTRRFNFVLAAALFGVAALSGCSEKEPSSGPISRLGATNPNEKGDSHLEPGPSTLGDTALPSLPLATPSNEDVAQAGSPLPDTVDDLFALLMAKQREIANSRDAAPQQMGERAVEIERVASKLLTLPLAANQTLLATQAKLDALLTRTQLGERNAKGLLEQFAASLEQEPAPLGEVAGMSLLFLDLALASQTPDQDLEAFHVRAEKLITQFPDSQKLFQTLHDIGCRRLRRGGQKFDAIRVMKLLANAYGESVSPAIVAAVEALPAQMHLTQLGFGQIVVDLQQGVDGAKARYIETVEQILEPESVDLYQLREVEMSLAWLEVSQQVEITQRTNGQLLDKLRGMSESPARDGLLHQAEMRVQRLQRMGQPLEFEATLADGTKLDWTPFQGEVVLTLFWSASSHASWDVLNKTAAMCDQLKPQGLRLVSVFVSPETDRLTTLFPNGFPEWPIVVDTQTVDSSPDNRLAQQFGVTSVPTVMLADRAGKVTEFISFLETRQSQEMLMRRIQALLAEPTGE